MADPSGLPEVFGLGDRYLIGPRPAREVAAIIRTCDQLARRTSGAGLPARALELADRLAVFAGTADHDTTALPTSRLDLTSSPTSTFMIDPITTRTAATLLGCTDNNVRQRLRRGTLTGQRIAGRWWIDRHDLERPTP